MNTKISTEVTGFWLVNASLVVVVGCLLTSTASLAASIPPQLYVSHSNNSPNSNNISQEKM